MPSITTVFRLLVMLDLLLYSVWFFWLDLEYGFLSQQTKDLVAWSGYGSKVPLPSWVDYLILILSIFISLGMMFFLSLARTMFIFFLIIILLATPFFGVSIETGVSDMIGDFVSVLDGAIIAIAYFTSIADKFDLKGS